MADHVKLPAPTGSGVAFVTGAFGFLGGAVAASLEASGWRVAAIGNPGRRPPAAVLIEREVDARSLGEAAERLGAPGLVFHAAGGGSVGASLADPAGDKARTVESLGRTLAFLEAHAPRARLIYPSSGAVYGGAHSGPIPETAPP